MEWMFLPLKRYAEFTGRSRRMEYWMFVLFEVLIGIAFVILILAVGGGGMLMSGGDPSAVMAAGGAIMAIMALNWLVSLALLIPALAVTVRRLHDTNRSGWWILAPICAYVVVFVGAAVQSQGLTLIGGLAALGTIILLLVFMFLEGTVGPNRFGEDPKGRGTAETFA